MELIRLTNKNPRCWGDVPEIRRVISEAAVAFRQSGIDHLINRVIANFVTEGHPDIPAAQQGMVAFWYVLDDDGKIVAHLLALEDNWDTTKCIYVNQLWAPHLRADVRAMAAEELDHYARSRGCKSIFMYTRRDTPRFWKDVFGFQRYRALYKRDVT